MTMRTKIWALVAIALVAGVAFTVGSASGDDGSTVACSSGQWVHATVIGSNGEKLSAENRRQLPAGYSDTTASGDQRITINSDGEVHAQGGEVVVECVAPTH